MYERCTNVHESKRKEAEFRFREWQHAMWRMKALREFFDMQWMNKLSDLGEFFNEEDILFLM